MLIRMGLELGEGKWIKGDGICGSLMSRMGEWSELLACL